MADYNDAKRALDRLHRVVYEDRGSLAFNDDPGNLLGTTDNFFPSFVLPPCTSWTIQFCLSLSPVAQVLPNSSTNLLASCYSYFLRMWGGEYGFVLENLVFKDFKVRYRNMSLGVFWSLLNPIIMMAVLTFVFTTVFPNPSIKAFPVFVLCGLIPFNFFSSAWANGTNCLIDNTGLIKRVPLPRALLPVASVLSNCTHLLIQIAVLLSFTLASGFGVNRYWTILPVVWFFEVLFVLGLVMACCALDVFIRDMRYVVESVNLILFWLVPIFYSFEMIPARFHGIYQYNPVAALVLALRRILMEASAPPPLLLWKLGCSSLVVFAAGWMIFHKLERRFYEHL